MGQVKGPFYSYGQLMSLWVQFGGDPSKAALAAAIAMAESGGGMNSTNWNSNGSTDRGLWQINTIHGSKSSYDVETNVRAAIAISNNGQNFKPWSVYNNGDYRKFYNPSAAPKGLPGGGTSSGGFGAEGGGAIQDVQAGGATTNPNVSLSIEDLQARYGFTADMLRADNSLRDLFNKAVAGGYSDSRFQAELMNTSWWRNQTAEGRQFWLKKFVDPSTASAQYNSKQAEVNVIAGEFGWSMFADATQRGFIDKATDAAINKGWNASQIRNYFAANLGNIKDGQHYGGKLGQMQDQLVEMGYKNGVKIDSAFINDWVHQMAKGVYSMEQAEHAIREKAANTWGAYREQIMAGMDMADIAAPYIKTMSTLLELPPGDIDLFDPTIRNNLQWKDPSTGAAPTPLPLWQFEQKVRLDKRWEKTNNARDAVMTDVHKVLADFGLRY